PFKEKIHATRALAFAGIATGTKNSTFAWESTGRKSADIRSGEEAQRVRLRRGLHGSRAKSSTSLRSPAAGDINLSGAGVSHTAIGAETSRRVAGRIGIDNDGSTARYL